MLPSAKARSSPIGVGRPVRRVLQVPVGGEMRDAFEYVLTGAQWPAAAGSLDDLSRLAASLLSDKEQLPRDRSVL